VRTKPRRDFPRACLGAHSLDRRVMPPPCDCQRRIKAALDGAEPSDGHDYVDEIIGLLRVARSQRDTAEEQLLKRHNAAGEPQPRKPRT
jgi:hypothetical protein